MTVNTSEYEFSHGRKPRGFGLWVFQVGEEMVWLRGAYTATKKQAIRNAKDKGVDSITVLP